MQEYVIYDLSTIQRTLGVKLVFTVSLKFSKLTIATKETIHNAWSRYNDLEPRLSYRIDSIFLSHDMVPITAVDDKIRFKHRFEYKWTDKHVQSYNDDFTRSCLSHD